MTRRFAIIPARALDDDNISNADLRILCAFGRETDSYGWCHVKQKTIAASSGMSRGYINNRIKNLVACGLLEQHHQTLSGRGQGASKYRLLFDVLAPPKTDDNSPNPDVAIDYTGEPVSSLDITPPVNSDITPNNTFRSSIPMDDATSAREIKNLFDEVLGNAINPKSHKMFVLTTPFGWTQGLNGCDLHLDLLPTIKRICANAPPHSISSWNYFRAAVFEARDLRLSEPDNPPPETRHAKQNNKSSAQLRSEANDRAFALAISQLDD